MVQIIDLDDALPPDKKVRLGGVVYTLPGDCPTPLYLRIQQARGILTAGGVEAVDQVIPELYDALLALFQERNPKVESLPLGLTQLITSLDRIYGPGEVEDDDEERPTPATTRGIRASSARSKSRSRS